MEEAELSLGPRALLIGLAVRQQHTLIGGMAEQQAVVLCCGLLLLLLQAAGLNGLILFGVLGSSRHWTESKHNDLICSHHVIRFIGIFRKRCFHH